MLQQQAAPSRAQVRDQIRTKRLRRLGLKPDQRRKPVAPVTTAHEINEDFKRRILKARADKITIADRASTSPLAEDFFKLAWKTLDSGVMISPIEVILRAVARRYCLSRAELLSHRRTKDIVRPRQVAMYLARRLTGASFPYIADRFGGRDHTGVQYGVSQIEDFIRKDEVIAAEIKSLIVELKTVVREAS